MASIKIKVIPSENEDELTEKKKKKQCTRGNPFHASDGTWSSKSDAKSWSIRTGGSDCEYGQLRQNPRRWLKRDCGRLDAKTPDVKAKYKCKTGKPVEEEVMPVNCQTIDINKKIKEPKKDEPETMEIEKKFSCGVRNVQNLKKKNHEMNRVREYESNFKDGKVWVNKEVFNQYMKYIDDQINKEPIEEVDKDGNLNKDEYRDTIMPGWREFLSLGRGIY